MSKFSVHLHQGLFQVNNPCYLLYTCLILSLGQAPLLLLLIPSAPSGSSGHWNSHFPALLALPSPVPSLPWCCHPPNLPTSKESAHSLPALQRLHLALDWALWIPRQPKLERSLRKEGVTPSSGRMGSWPPTKASKEQGGCWSSRRHRQYPVAFSTTFQNKLWVSVGYRGTRTEVAESDTLTSQCEGCPVRQ